MSLLATWYIYKIFTGKVRPALSTWIILFTGTSLSLITYLLASDWNFTGNFVNVMDPLIDMAIILTIVFWSKTKIKFDSFEKWYLATGGLITLFWILSNNPFVSNLLIQALIFVAYFPTIQKLIIEKTKTESYFLWSIMIFTGVVAIFPVVVSGNLLSIIYTGRTILMPSIIIFLMLIINKNSALADKK